MEPIKEVVLEKVYDASVAKVWEAWTNADMLKQWWGSEHVTIPECEVDLKIGGKFYIVMEAGAGMGPYKGTKWPMLAEYTEITSNEKLSYTAHAWTEGDEEETTIEQITEVVFAEEGNQTKITVKAAIYKAGPKAGMAAEGMRAGFTQQLEKLGTFLVK